MLRALAAFCLLLCLVACERPADYHATSYVFGTRVDIEIYGAQQAKAENAANAVFSYYDSLHHTLHSWKPGALLDLNRSIEKGEAAATVPEVLEMIRLSTEYYQQSNGLFDPAIGKLVAMWGFHSDIPVEHPPSQTRIDDYLKHLPGMNDYRIEGNIVSSDNREDWLDFGGIAKGWAIDKGIDILQQHGIDNAVINAGGDLKVIGRHGDRPWHIGIRNPKSQQAIAAVDLKSGEAIFTSGNYERYYEINGKRYHHIIDPRTGYPAEHVASSTVIETDAAKADAAATSLLIAGMNGWRELAANMKLNQAMLIDWQGKIRATPAMQKRLELLEESDKGSMKE